MVTAGLDGFIFWREASIRVRSCASTRSSLPSATQTSSPATHRIQGEVLTVRGKSPIIRSYFKLLLSSGKSRKTFQKTRITLINEETVVT
jgi:hypothetical protein